MKLCKSCAHEIDSNAEVCRYCGAIVTNKTDIVINQAEEKQYREKTDKPEFMDNGLIRGPYKKGIAITLCILLGWLGAHKFYEGKYMVGVFYAVTIGLCGVGVIFDLLRLIKKEKYYYVSRIPFIL